MKPGMTMHAGHGFPLSFLPAVLLVAELATVGWAQSRAQSQQNYPYASSNHHRDLVDLSKSVPSPRPFQQSGYLRGYHSDLSRTSARYRNATGLENKTVSACFSSNTKMLVARCGPGARVHIVDLFYGHSTSHTCSYQPGDCTLPDFVIHGCVGSRSCQVNLPSGGIGRRIPHCNLDSSYKQLTYQCVPDNLVYDVCENRVLRHQRGYLRTPQYPESYPPGLSCTTSIQAMPTQRIRLHLIDFDVGCQDMLYLRGELKSSSFCGKREPKRSFFTTVGTTLNLTITSDSQGVHKGFWMYYEAIPYIPTTTTSTTTTVASTPQLTTQSSTVVPVVRHETNAVLPPEHSTQQTVYATDVTQESRLPLEAIVGGLLGSLLCILFVLLILLIIKRRKEREAMPSSTSTCFLHSKAGVSAGPYIQNNLAMVDDSPMC